MEERAGPSVLDIAFRIVGAVTATLAAYRAVRGAMTAWQRVVSTIRGDEKSDRLDGSSRSRLS
jgi:hypothetical protein